MIKLLEVYDEEVFIHKGDLEKPTYRTKEPLRKLNIRPDFIKIIGFPFKLVESPYHAFRIFSPDFRHFIDWSHNDDNF